MADIAFYLGVTVMGGFVLFQAILLVGVIAEAFRPHPFGELLEPEADQHGAGGGDPDAFVRASQIGFQVPQHGSAE